MTTVRQIAANGETPMTGEAQPPPNDRQWPVEISVPRQRFNLVQAPPVGYTTRGVLAVVFGAILCFGAGYGASEYSHFRVWLDGHTKPVPEGDATVGVPAELHTTVGESVEVVASTRGERVIWQSLSAELSLHKSGPKSVLVTARRPGTFRLQCYSSVEGLPTTPAIIAVIAKEDKP